MLRLLDILQVIAHDGFLGGRLALKGGTALNAFHIGMGRLSVDIYLNYLGPVGDGLLPAERDEVDAALTRILVAEGYMFRKWYPGPTGSAWELRFASALGGTARLSVDLGFKDRQPLFGAARMSSVALGGRKVADMLVVHREEVIAAKLSALFERTRARDLFDALRIKDIDGLDWTNIKAAFLMFTVASFADWSRVSIGAAGDPHKACQNLLSCLPRRHFAGRDATVAWYHESVEICRDRFGRLLKPTPRETEFLDGVQKRGEINAKLLKASPEIRDRIAVSPRLAWKCQRVLEERKTQTLSVRRRPSGRSMGL